MRVRMCLCSVGTGYRSNRRFESPPSHWSADAHRRRGRACLLRFNTWRRQRASGRSRKKERSEQAPAAAVGPDHVRFACVPGWIIHTNTHAYMCLMSSAHVVGSIMCAPLLCKIKRWAMATAGGLVAAAAVAVRAGYPCPFMDIPSHLGTKQ